MTGLPPTLSSERTTRSVDDGPPVEAPVPEVAPSRVHRMRWLRARRRRRLAVLCALALMAALVAVSEGPELFREGLRRVGPAEAPARSPSPESLLVAFPTADGSGAVVVLFGVSADGEQATALLVPAYTQVEVPSLGPETLARSLRLGGVDLLALALENALGVDVREGVALDEGGIRSVLAVTRELEVRLREAVDLGDAGAVYGAGDQVLTPAEATTLLTARGEDTDDFAHLVTVHAVLEAWLRALHGDRAGAAAERLAAQPGGPSRERLEELIGRLARAEVRFDTLKVTPIDLGENELYRLDERSRADLGPAFDDLLFRAGGERVKVEIVNGTGEVALARRVAGRILPAGAEVVLTGNAPEFDVTRTLVVLHDPQRRADAERLVEALGVGELRMARQPLGVVDVSIVVGTDFGGGAG